MDAIKFDHKNAEWEWDNRLPDDDPEQIAYCKKSCPFYKPYKHPFYHYTIWCSHLIHKLYYHDGIMALCQVDLQKEDKNRKEIEQSMRAERRLKLYNNRNHL